MVNPPAAQTYRNGSNDTRAGDSFGRRHRSQVAVPDWVEWLKKQDSATVDAKGARIPGEGKLKAIEDAPGRYVKAR